MAYVPINQTDFPPVEESPTSEGSQSPNISGKFYSSKILNYVEREDIAGFAKTVFYTEVNTNLNVGDRVFIVNGNYDSSDISLKNKYSRFTDGYRVLSAEKCRIVLDIDYTGSLPYIEPSSGDFIYIKHIKTQSEFDYINSVKFFNGDFYLNPYSGDVYPNYVLLSSQFVVYASQPFKGSNNASNPSGVFGEITNEGIWMRIDDGGTNPWIDITFLFFGNKIKANPRYSTSGDIFILGENFTLNGKEFIQRNVYKFENDWITNPKYFKPYISKLNFRWGKFEAEHNDGIYGSYDRKFHFENSKWNSGVMINTVWKNGIMNSKHTTDETSYIARLEISGTSSVPIQTLDNTNNRGFGYNFIEDSDFEQYVINNGNFNNCNFFSQSVYTSGLDVFYGKKPPFTNIINGGKYELSDIYDVNGSGVYLLNSTIRNSTIRLSKVVSCDMVNTSLSKGFWSSDGGIKILAADLWSLDLNEGQILNSQSAGIKGTLKLYISDEDFLKLNYGDTFYIPKLNKEVIQDLLSENQKILHILESKFIIDTYNDYDLKTKISSSGPESEQISVSLKTTKENKWKYYVNPGQSIDNYRNALDSSATDYWYKIPKTNVGEEDSSFRGDWLDPAVTANPYYWGDWVLDPDPNDPQNKLVYRYFPFDRDTFVRKKSQSEILSDYSTTIWGDIAKPIGDEVAGRGIWSDWVVVGDYKGNWDEFSFYEGTDVDIDENLPPDLIGYLDETDRLRVPYGNVVLNQEDLFHYHYVGTTPHPSDGNKSFPIYVNTISTSKNNFIESTINLPSIDITCLMFGWYEDEDGNFKPSKDYGISPIDSNNVNLTLKDIVLANGDFKSGLMSESTWLSGDNTNYMRNIIRKSGIFYVITLIPESSSPMPGKRALKIKLGTGRYSTKYQYDGFDWYVNDYAWLQSLDYRLGSSSYSLDGRYKVVKVDNSSNDIWLVSEDVVDKLANLPFAGKVSLSSGSTNNYLSIAKLLIENSNIESGKFRRTNFFKSKFLSPTFQKYKYPSDLPNTSSLRLVNLFSSRTQNIYKSGYLYKSHFIDGEFNGATFYDSIWINATFSDGLFKNSVWVGGNFNGGKFVDSRESTVVNFDYDTKPDNKLWQGGNFNGGEFFNSLWVRGTFNNGRFYNSDWTGGIWNGGILGSNLYQDSDTTMGFYSPTTSFGMTFTTWNNGVVENAWVGGDGAVDWYYGKMLGGRFGSNGRTIDTHSVWYDGEFYGASFVEKAWWKNGKFYSGKFLSNIGWTSSSFSTHSNDSYDYGWVDGEFLGGEFGNASVSENSMWYDGKMSGGIFQGRFWRTGVLTNGKFYGGLFTFSETNTAIKSYGPAVSQFYGLWNDGYVTSNEFEFTPNKVAWTRLKSTQQENPKVLPLSVDMEQVLWKSGTFSHDSANFNNSVWLDGEFKSGDFNNSKFNPFVDLTFSNLLSTDYENRQLLRTMYQSIIDNIVNNPTFDAQFLSGKNNYEEGTIYTFRSLEQFIPTNLIYDTIISQTSKYINSTIYDINVIGGNFENNPNIDGRQVLLANELATWSPLDSFWEKIDSLNNSLYIEIYNPRLRGLDRSDVLYIIINNNYFQDLNGFDAITGFDFKIVYSKINETNPTLKFNPKSTCVWTGGNFNSGEFNYSKWYRGKFNGGTMMGGIWLGGIFNYGTMLNSYWENGIWRNGTWNGSPFDGSLLDVTTTSLTLKDFKARDIILNISNYTSNNNLHINNIFGLTGSTTNIHGFNLVNGWTFSVEQPADSEREWDTQDGLEPNFYTEGRFNSYKLFINDLNNSSNIFDDWKYGYEISLGLRFTEFIFNGLPTTINRKVIIQFGVGNLDTVTKSYDVDGKFVTVNFYYQPSEFGIKEEGAKKMWIRKVGGGRIRLVSSTVKKVNYEYITNLNNTLFDSVKFNSQVSFPGNQDFKVTLGGKKGDNIGIKFGNGRFKSGIWKTGVWQDGWRGYWKDTTQLLPGDVLEDDDIFYFDSIDSNTYKVNPNRWYLKLKSNSNPNNIKNIKNNLKANDFVSIGNVVGIDINSQRYLLKDYYRIVEIKSIDDYSILTIDVPIAQFPMLEFKMDSNVHIIYLTKNIWLGGTFLNGYFRGIWNSGLFKGFPMTTVMDESHFITGKFDGGRFISREKQIKSAAGDVTDYHTGLIEYFEFYDNNVSEKEGVEGFIDNKYLSWIDVNYYTESFVNLNSSVSIYDDNFQKSVPLPNLYGYPTRDVISSYSKFKNATDSGVEYYNLGTKYNVYKDYLGESGYFTKPFNSEGKPGLESFTSEGWRADNGNFFGTPTVSFVYNSNITKRNFNKFSAILQTAGYNVLNNNKIIVGDKKYILVEYYLDYFQRGIDPMTGQFTNTFAKPLNLLGSNYPGLYNNYSSKTLKTEFFYNKNALDLILRYNSIYEPPPQSLYMFGYNYTYSNWSGETDGYGGTSYSTTYSIIMPGTSSYYQEGLLKAEEWKETGQYVKNDVVRRASDGGDSLGSFFICIKDTSNPAEPVFNEEYWLPTLVGYNDGYKEFSIIEQDSIFSFFTSMRITYFKFLEIDSLPFFKYFDFETNFASTYKSGSRLGLEFTKPHGFKADDIVNLLLDETKFNPDYEGTWKVYKVEDGIISNGDSIYTVTLDIPYGTTVSILNESGTINKVGYDRIDRRIQTNLYVESPKIDGLNEDLVYLGNNVTSYDLDQFEQ